MGWEGWFALAVIVAMLYGLVKNLPADGMIVGAALSFGLVGILTPEEVFDGFSNPGMLTVAALYVVAAALRETGALDILGRWLLGRSETETGVITRMAVAVTGISAVLNNTPVVAMFIPVLTKWCRKHRVSASRLLMPLSYLSILGGTCTLIGTSTNLVVNGLMIQLHKENPERYADLAPMGLFEIGQVGLPYAIVGVLYLVFIGRHLLPKRKDFLESMGETSREYLANMQIQPGCPLASKTVAQAGLRHLDGLFLIEIRRGGEVLAPVQPDQTMHEGDILTFTGVVENIVDLERIRALELVTEETAETEASSRQGGMFCEAVVSNTSPLIGKTIRASNFRALYNSAVVAVNRGGERLRGRVGDIVVRQGDTLLLQAGAHFTRAHHSDPDFFLVSGVEDSRPVRHERAIVSILLTGVLILLLATNRISTEMAAFLVAGLMVGTRCISVAEARQSIDLQTLLTIAAAFGIAKALDNSGFVHAAASNVVELAGSWGPTGVLTAICLLTATLTAVITNNAAAALMFPFALAVAEQLHVSPRPFAMGVAFAASASFLSPLGYQTNLMVFGPGGYHFTDFGRVGIPLSCIMLIVVTLIVPYVWHF